jgi:hypothetical protein
MASSVNFAESGQAMSKHYFSVLCTLSALLRPLR